MTDPRIAELQAQLDELKTGKPAAPPKTDAEKLGDAKAAVASYATETHGGIANGILITILTVIIDVLQKIVAAQSSATEGGTVPVVPADG